MKTKEKDIDLEVIHPKILLKKNCNILTPTKGLSKTEWLRFRQMGIGGSDIASVCGINQWKSPLALWHEKTEKIQEEEEENIPAEVGLALEPFMKRRFEKWIEKEEGANVTVAIVPYILQHKTNKIALANLDGVFIHPDKLACLTEYKTTSEHFYKQWQDENLPDNYYLQIQWYLYVTGLEYCYLSFLIGNRKFDVLLIERNQEVIDEIVEKADFFWKTYVMSKVAPVPDGSFSSGEALKKMYPKEEEGKIIDVTGDGDIEHILMSKIILDLCGGTGAWSKDYKEAGYIVFNITLPFYDVLKTEIKGKYIIFQGGSERPLIVKIDDIYGILAAPVCTDFSFAKTNAKYPRDMRRAMKLIIACLNIIWECQYNLPTPLAKRTNLKFWALENPYGLLRRYLGHPVIIFNPYDFGDSYQKKTCLWGFFNIPKKNLLKEYSKDYIHTISPNGKYLKPYKSLNPKLQKKFDMLASRNIAPEMFGKLTRQEKRAITPQGFAKAFFEANK